MKHTHRDPLELTVNTEKIVCDGLKRKYESFHISPIWKANDYQLENPNLHWCAISTTMTGCNLRCYFCSTTPHRDYPEKYGRFFTPQEATSEIIRLLDRYKNILCVDFSGGECLIGKEHLLKVLNILFYEKRIKQVTGVLTNGIILGNDKSYVKALSTYPNPQFYVRIGLKAGTSEGLEQRCGAYGKYYELPFKAIKYCLDYRIKTVVFAMTDARIMPEQERKILLENVREIDSSIRVQEERFYPYPDAVERVKESLGVTSECT